MANFADVLNAGSHSFSFYAGNEKYYLLSATSSNASQSIKMMNFSNGGHQIKLDYQGKAESAGFKSQKAIGSFDYALGNQLRFTSYAATTYGVGSNVFEDAPQISKTYQFSKLEGVPCPGMPTVTDIDGNIYNTVQIGNQCWMKENLKVGNIVNGSVEQTNNGIIGKYCYENQIDNCAIYGGLYQWDEMMQYSTTPGIQGICMTGWHLPTNEEWIILTDFLRGESIAGGEMKETGTTHWGSPNMGATNSSGFTALPGGYRYIEGSFHNQRYNGYWWASSPIDDSHAWRWHLDYYNNQAFRYYYDKLLSFSVRCIKD